MRDMKLIIVLLCAWAAIICTSDACAESFSPTPLTLDIEPSVRYAFDGSPLEIPVHVSGVDAKAMFCVFTSGQQNMIGEVTNGHLGWHYVNHIDTCVYHAGWPFELQKGYNVFIWDGADQDGNPVAPGDYTYYFWAYDNETPRQPCCYHAFPHSSDFAVVTEDGDGLPLANPLYYTREIIYREGLDFFGGRGNHLQRWAIGNDPKNAALVESCLPALPEGFAWEGCTAIHPADINTFYIKAYDTTIGVSTVIGCRWKPDGTSEMNTGFGCDGMTGLIESAPLKMKELHIAPLFYRPSDYTGVSAGSDYLYTADCEYKEGTVTSRLHVYDYEGNAVDNIDLGEWWYAPYGDTFNGGSITSIDVRNDKVFLSSHNYCLKQMLDPVTYLESGNIGDLYVWANSNGDYFVDKNFMETSESPWVCYGYSEHTSEYTIWADANLFSICHTYDSNSYFCLLAPDGTGLSYNIFFSTNSSPQNYSGCFLIDSGSAYDGIYTGLEKLTTQHLKHRIEKGTYYSAQDCVRGLLIPDDTGLNNHDAPALFTLHQNTPNPFNPSTAISFTLFHDAYTTLKIFNIAGICISEIIDGYCQQGDYSYNWDARGNPTGIYFFTLTAGGYSQTKKMMMIK